MTTTADCPIRPMDDRVVIVRDEPEPYSKGGFFIPDPEPPITGTVMAVGPGRRDHLGRRIVVGVVVGDRVRFEPVGGTAVDIDGDEWLVIPERHLLARYT
jgi:chaperonin GroES